MAGGKIGLNGYLVNQTTGLKFGRALCEQSDRVNRNEYHTVKR